MVNTKYSYIVVEGQHDIAIIGKILKLNSIKKVELYNNLDKFWDKIIPKNFPHNGNLLKRVPVPNFFQDDSKNFSIAIQEAIGDTNIETLLNDSLLNLDSMDEITGVAIFTDADDKLPKIKFESIIKNLINTDIAKVIKFPSESGEVSSENTNFGVYIFPDNKSIGTLEDILIRCGENSYPDIIEKAKNFVNCIPKQNYNSELKDFNKPSGKNKSVLGCTGNVFKPGKSIQVSIQDNKWISQETIEKIPEVKVLNEFIKKIVGIV